MEYVYAAMLLHAAKKEITEKSVHDVLVAAGISPDSGKIKALVSSLKEVNIEEAIKAAAIAPVAAAPASGQASEKAKEEPEEDKAKNEEAAAEGLSALFG
jgi:large subunit ribosomal protein L12